MSRSFRAPGAARLPGRARSDTGAVTVEAAVSLLALAGVVGMLLFGLGLLGAQLAVGEASRAAARLAARGDAPGAVVVEALARRWSGPVSLGFAAGPQPSAAGDLLVAAREVSEKHGGAASKLALDLAMAMETGAGSSAVAAKKPTGKPGGGGKPGGAAPARPKGDDFEK